jgi:hypothetical protein
VRFLFFKNPPITISEIVKFHSNLRPTLAREVGNPNAVDMKGFTELVTRKIQDATNESEIIAAFQVFDENADGTITIAALRWPKPTHHSFISSCFIASWANFDSIFLF